jgi:hypothetical protein
MLCGNKLPMTKASKNNGAQFKRKSNCYHDNSRCTIPFLWLDPRSWQRIKSNQIHPSPTKQQQLRPKMVVLGFSALEAALCLEQTWFHCKPWFRTDPVIIRLSSKESIRYHPRCYPDLWMCKVEMPQCMDVQSWDTRFIMNQVFGRFMNSPQVHGFIGFRNKKSRVS